MNQAAALCIKLSTLVAWLGLSACSSNHMNSWMEDYSVQIESKPLSQVLIPGSHFANAYGINSNQHLVICSGETKQGALSTNAYLAQLIATSGKQSAHDFLNYLTTQNSNISEQLNSGIRYLELQICLQDANYYTSNYYLTDTLDSIIQQIKDFLKENPQELIIIDVDNNLHSNSGIFTKVEAKNFHEYLQLNLSKNLLSKQAWPSLTFNKIWKSKQRIILFSTNQYLVTYPEIWNKNEVTLTRELAHYTTIKKLTALQKTIQAESTINNQQYYSIIPIYSWLSAESNNIAQLKRNSNDHLILEYLYTLPPTAKLNIIVTDHQYLRPLANFALQKNTQ